MLLEKSESSDRMSEMSVDDVFRKIGQFGRIQKFYFFVIGVLCMIPPLHTFASTFIDFTPSWVCLEEEKEAALSTKLCSRLSDGHCAVQYEEGSPQTTVTEWQLLCDNSYLARLPQSLYFAGMTLSSLTMGGFGDKYGRRFLSLLCTALSVLFSGLSAVSFNIYIYVAVRFCLGFAVQGLILGSTVWIFELTGPDHQSRLQALTSVFCVACAMALPGVSILFPYWRYFILVSSVAFVIPLVFASFIPKSPSWLLVSGRKKEARNVLSHIAKGNHTVLPNDVDLMSNNHKPQAAKGLASLFSFREITRRSLIQFFCWFVLCSTYYGVSFALGDNMGGNRYFNFCFGAFVEAPAILLALPIADRFGRCKGMSLLNMISGTCLILAILGSAVAAPFSPSVAVFVRVCLAMVGRLCNSAAFTIAYFFAAELFPTEVRNVGLGFVSVGSRLGGIISPFVLYVENIGVPIALLGVLSVCAGILSLSLPETKGQPTPETLEELRASSTD